MSIVATDPHRFQMLQESLALFWPDPPEDLWIVVSWADPSQGFCSQWVRVRDLDQALLILEDKSQQYDTYVGMGLRRAGCHPVGRGTSDAVGAIGGLWVECDHTGGVHRATQLPTPFQLMKFLEALPFQFSLLIDSTGGFHGHLLFKELWVLDSPGEHAAAALLLRRLQRTIQIAALARGWQVDTTADLARVLRVPGTFNHKSGTPQLVTIAEATQVRYNPSDLADAPWLAEVVDTYTAPTGSGDFADAHLDRMVPGCAWLAHCQGDAATLPEPEWYAMLGIVGRCVDGEQHVHAWSAPYPHYDQRETTKKFQHALKAAGPATCNRIRYDLGGEPSCASCVHWGQIASPIVLAMDDGVRLVPGSNGPPWTHALLRSSTTDIVQQTINNCILALQHLEPWKSEGCWYDSVRERHMIGARPVEDLDAVHAGALIEQAIKMRVSNLRLVGHALDYVCRQKTRDLLREWVDTLPDAAPTTLLTTWLRTYAGVPPAIPDAYVADVSRLIPVGMMARILAPGCQYRYVPIFEGDEDMGKSKLTKALAGVDPYGQSWHVALSAGMEGKEAHMMLEGALVAELEELSSYTKTDENRMKALVTMQTDSFVPKFANKRVDHPRRTIFIATVNPEGDGAYLKGQTGNTRWLPVQVGAIDVEGFLTKRTQLFAEAKAYYLAHPQDWWHMTSGVEATTEREGRRQKSVYEGEKLEAWLYARKLSNQLCTWDEVAEDCFQIAKDRWNKALQMEIAKALKASSWVRDRTTRHRYWKPV